MNRALQDIGDDPFPDLGFGLEEKVVPSARRRTSDEKSRPMRPRHESVKEENPFNYRQSSAPRSGRRRAPKIGAGTEEDARSRFQDAEEDDDDNFDWYDDAGYDDQDFVDGAVEDVPVGIPVVDNWDGGDINVDDVSFEDYRNMSKQWFEQLDDDSKRDAFVRVMDQASWLPMRTPKLRGLAKLLQPEGEYRPRVDFDGFHGLHRHDFMPIDAHRKMVNQYDACEIDRLLSHNEEFAELLEAPREELTSVAEWFDGMGLSQDDPRRGVDRMVRYLEEMCSPRHSLRERRSMLKVLRHAVRFDVAQSERESAKS